MFFQGDFGGSMLLHLLPLRSTVSVDVGIEPKTVAFFGSQKLIILLRLDRLMKALNKFLQLNKVRLNSIACCTQIHS
jgi:hypothetical protein